MTSYVMIIPYHQILLTERAYLIRIIYTVILRGYSIDIRSITFVVLCLKL